MQLGFKAPVSTVQQKVRIKGHSYFQNFLLLIIGPFPRLAPPNLLYFILPVPLYSD